MSRKITYLKSALVTGASSGIGKSVALMLAQAGLKVYAASRHPQQDIQSFPGGGSIIPITMDVASEASVKEASKAIGELGIIVHCAGIGISGSAEVTPDQRARAQMDTNYFGVLNVNRVFMERLRQNKASLIQITSSVAGIVPIPYQSHYSSSKYALEAYAQALRMEARPFGVRVALVEPGDTKTGFTKARSYDEDPESVYYDACMKAVEKMASDEQNGKGPETVAKVILKNIYRSNPPVRQAVGASYKALSFLIKVLPARLVLLLVSKIYLPAQKR